MSSTIERPGCLILLIDESLAMQSLIAVSAAKTTKTKAESCATAINSFLNRLAAGPDFDVAIVGYRSDGDQTDVGPRWAGPLSGRDFVRTSELAENPIRIEERIRRRPSSDGDSTVPFPIWYEPTLSGQAPQVAAFTHCMEQIEQWLANAEPNAAPPILCHVTASSSADGNPQKAIQYVQKIERPTGTPLIGTVFLSSHAQVEPNNYPSNRSFLPRAARTLYDRSSLLPEELIRELRQEGLRVNDRARFLVYNAQMVDVVRCLTLLKQYTETWPARVPAMTSTPIDEEPTATAVEERLVSELPSEEPPELEVVQAGSTDEPQGREVGIVEEPVTTEDQTTVSESPRVSPEQPAAIVLVLDRSMEAPYSGQMNHICAQLCAEANELLAEIAEEGSGAIEVAVVSYGCQDGEIEIRRTFDEPLADRVFVRDTELRENPLRMEDVIEKVDDGTGGLLEIPKKKRIFLEIEPAEPASVTEAFSTVADLLAEWLSQHECGLGPIVLHLTRGQIEPEEIEQAVSQLQQIDSLTLYHSIKPEYGHPTVFYPTDDRDIENDCLKALFAATSPLLGAARIAEEGSSVRPDSRGIVIKGKFTMLLPAIHQATVG